VLIPVAVFMVVLRWFQRSAAPVDGIRALPSAGFTAAFTWLNVEPWINGLPLIVVGPPPPFHPPAYFSTGITLGFPVIFWNGFTSEVQFHWIAANVVIGINGWTALFLARSLAKRSDRRE